MKKTTIGFILLIFIPFISGLCDENQVNINSASVKELDKIYGIGPKKAQAIIDSRPFNSVDELRKTNGIGEKTLQKIKEQGLACVSDNENKKEDKEIETEERKNETREENKEEINTTKKPKNINPKNINTEKNKDNKETKPSCAVYVLVGFCVLLVILFILKPKTKKYKTEFQDE